MHHNIGRQVENHQKYNLEYDGDGNGEGGYNGNLVLKAQIDPRTNCTYMKEGGSGE